VTHNFGLAYSGTCYNLRFWSLEVSDVASKFKKEKLPGL
jgi:hypothetical protein